MKNFIERWKNHGYERGESQKFWIDLLETLGVQNVSEKIFFEQQINGKFIDAIIPSKKILIEQKSLGKNLSDAYIQAKNYDNALPFDKKSRWIICSDFQTFHVHDMNNPKNPPEIILLKNLAEDEFLREILLDENDEVVRRLKISLQAGEIVKKLYNALRKNYLQPDDEKSLQSLNKLCVRIVFCLYAESTGIFGDKKIFRNYLNQFSAKNLRRALKNLFQILDTKISDRAPYLEEDLKKFPYVNGNLFAEEIEIPNFNDEIKFFLLEYASRNFDWSGISPTIFGAVFESTLNPLTRREGGMHYTSIENIHKVIDPLFLDNLREEFVKCKTRRQLLTFQDKLASLKFFDPACGSGNFLTETYLSLRKLENELLKKLMGEQIQLGELDNPIKVSINQFYGVEINDFAVAVAKTALWISELQMLDETQKIIHKNLNPLPLKNFANIFEGNALRLDWQKICPEPNYIFGNPPFVGRSYRTREQVADISKFFTYKDVDYVACWYKKAVEFIKGTKIECAFVSTNSITQGEQVAAIWKNLGVEINFCHRTFVWNSESTDKAHVHCVIISFANFARKQKIIFDGDNKIFAKNINGYLIDAPNFFLQNRSKPIQKNIPPMFFGNMAADNKKFSLTEDEKNSLIKKFPDAEKFIKILLGGREFLHNEKRFCLWLVDASPSEIKKIPPIYERIKKVREFRLNSSFKKIADRSHEFRDLKNPKNFIAVPRVTSGEREYIPIGFLGENFIANDQLLIIPNGDKFLFGILESSVHMIWTKTFCGRLGDGFRYSKQIIYNNFPFCAYSETIEQTAQNILDCRKKYPDASLADLYDPILMPVDLRDAHKKNDRAVIEAYGFENLSEEEILSELMILHENLTK